MFKRINLSPSCYPIFNYNKYFTQIPNTRTLLYNHHQLHDPVLVSLLPDEQKQALPDACLPHHAVLVLDWRVSLPVLHILSPVRLIVCDVWNNV